MTEMEKLKKQLEEQYRFEMIMSPSDVNIILENNNNEFFSDMVVFSLLAGCVGIEATIMETNTMVEGFVIANKSRFHHFEAIL